VKVFHDADTLVGLLAGLGWSATVHQVRPHILAGVANPVDAPAGGLLPSPA
jgi:hypothetical protein